MVLPKTTSLMFDSLSKCLNNIGMVCIADTVFISLEKPCTDKGFVLASIMICYRFKAVFLNHNSHYLLFQFAMMSFWEKDQFHENLKLGPIGQAKKVFMR